MTDTAASETITHEHGGRAWEIPADLVALQRESDAAAGAVDTLVDGDDVEALAQSRARRLDLTDRLYEHPWLREQFNRGCRHQADLALKDCARRR
jgi:hypothetical protein